MEDGAVLGALFERVESKSQFPDILSIYERLRKHRTTRIVQGSTALRNILHMEDGDQQRERDYQLTHLAPFHGYPNRWADLGFQTWLFGYDTYGEVEVAWLLYQMGQEYSKTAIHPAFEQ